MLRFYIFVQSNTIGYHKCHLVNVILSLDNQFLISETGICDHFSRMTLC